MKKSFPLIIALVTVLSTFGSPVFGADVTLRWAANPEPLDGYYVHYKADFCCEPYDNEIRVPLDSLDNPPDPDYPEYTVHGLLPNTAYYFVVQAYEGDERSGFSNEARIKAPQIVSQPVETYVSNNAVTIEWATSEPGDSEVRYGFTSTAWGAYPESKETGTSVTSHSISLTGLLPETEYHYRGGSTNELGIGPEFEDDDANPSRDIYFTTAPAEEPDTTPPQFLIQPYATSIADTRVIIEWKTDETANGRVDFGKTVSYGQTESIPDIYTADHVMELVGLEPDTVYHARVRSVDQTGNSLISSDFTFRTLITPDTTAPIFTSPPTVVVATDRSATIEWTTNEPSNTKVRYGTMSATWRTYPSKVEDFTNYVLRHRAVITGLTPSTTYYFRAGSSDPVPNQTLSAEYTFTTADIGDTTPPKIITAPTVIIKTDTSATIVWDTDETANSVVRYWEESWAEPRTWANYQYSKNVSALTSQHTVTLTNLTGETRYFFMVGSSDADGNGPTTSFESSFATKETPDIDAPQIISPPTITAKTNQTVTIEWITDEPSNSTIQYGENSSSWGNYPLNYFKPEGVTHHRAVIAGLDSETLYFFRVGGTDAYNNGPDTDPADNNPSAEISVLTEPDPDFSAPLITAPPTVTAKTDSVAIVEWSTDEPSTSIVHYGTASGDWDSYPLIENNPDMVVEHFVVLVNLNAGQKYYFRVGSVDEHGNGPQASFEIFFTTDAVADSESPRITLPPTVTGITDSTAIVEWETDEPSNSEVKYVVTPESGAEPDLVWGDTSLAVVNTKAMVTRHSVTLTNLQSGKRYFFTVGSTDAAGNGPDPDDIESNNPFTKDFFYTEITGDERAPTIISGPAVTARDNQSAIIEWETDEPSNSIVRFDTTARTWFELTYGTFDTGLEECFDDEGFEECYPVDEDGNRLDEITYRSESDSELVTLHSVTIRGLQPSTTYYFRVGSTDALGNGPDLNQDATNPSTLGNFLTAEGPDEIAPYITNLKVFFVTNTTALIIWDTDEPSNSIIQYGLTGGDWDDYTFEESDSGMVRQHSITITGLQPDRKYYFRAGSIDAVGNGPWLNDRVDREGNPSEERTFTSAAGPDITAPQISNVRITSFDDESALVEWTTDEPGNSQVRYDTTSKFWAGYRFGENDAEMVTEHRVSITGLSPSTLYYIRVSSTDASGNNYDTSFNDKNPSIEYNTATSDADPPSIIVYPEAGYPKVDSASNTIQISYDELNMQNATVVANYFFSPALIFANQENPIRPINEPGERSTYRLSFVLVPEYTVFTLTVLEGTADADGHRVEPATILINDNDADGLADDWEVAVGLDPTSAEESDGQGSDGDFDNDGYSNYDEFINRTDPTDSKDFPSSSAVLEVLPHDNAGIDDDFRVANNASFAVFISDRKGIDISSDTSVVFTADDGINAPYPIDLGDTNVFRVIRMIKNELDTSVTQLWAVYDRSRDDRYGVFPFEAVVSVSVRVTNKMNDVVEKSYLFKIETEAEHSDATDPLRIPQYTILEGDDPDLNDDLYVYDTGFQLIPDEQPGAKLIYNSSDIEPEIGPLEDLPPFDVTGANAIGMPLNLGPPTIFNVPVKLIIPVPEDTRVKALSVFVHNGKEWVLGCDTSGKSPNLNGWLVPGSRVNGKNRIEFKVYHFSGIQTALLGEGTGAGASGKGAGADQPAETASCFIGDLLD